MPTLSTNPYVNSTQQPAQPNTGLITKQTATLTFGYPDPLRTTGRGLMPALDFSTTAFPAVNSITINGNVMPGKWTLISAPKIFGWQVQAAVGSGGATIYPSFDPLVEIHFRVEFFASQDYAAYRNLRKLLLKKPVMQLLQRQPTTEPTILPQPAEFGPASEESLIATEINAFAAADIAAAEASATKASNTANASAALTLYHPELSDMGITAVVVKEVHPTIQEKAGLWVAEIKFLQFRLPVLLPGAPTVIPGSGGPNPQPKTTVQLDSEVTQQAIVAGSAH